MTNKLSFLLLLAVLFLSYSCDDDDDPVIENEEEVITTVVLTMAPADNQGATVIYTFSDPDGDGGNAPTITTSGGPLAANTTYNTTVLFSNPDEDITEEVREEDDEHQVFYLVSGGLNLDLAYADQDGDGNPLGLMTTATTGAASTGMIQVVLRHEPTKGSAVGITDLAAAGGETDIEVNFQATIQ